MKKEYQILSYECAYNQLIICLSSRYWRLIETTKEENKPHGLFTPLRLGFYQAMEGGHQYRGLFDGSSREHGEQLNGFLKNIYATQDSRKEGSTSLFRWINGVLKSSGDRHFIYNLAQIAISFSLRNNSSDFNRAIQLIPLKAPPIQKFYDNQAERIEKEINEICNYAQKIIDKYEGKLTPEEEAKKQAEIKTIGTAYLFAYSRSYGI